MGKLQTGVLIILLAILSIVSFELYSKVKDGYAFESKTVSEKTVGNEIVYENSGHDKIEIGLIMALTGTASSGDKGALEGAKLAVEKLNSEGGAFGKEFSLVPLDNRGTAIGSREAAKKAVHRGVAGVIGPERSSYALASGPVLQDNKIPMITHLSTHTDVTRIGNYIFRACYTNEFQGEELAKYTIDELKAKRAVVLRMVDEDYSTELSDYFRQEYEKLGGVVVWTGDYKAKEIDYTDLILKMKKIQPEIVFIAGYTKDIGLIIRQAREMEIDAQFLSGDGIESRIYNFGGPAVNGLHSSTHWHEDLESEESKSFVESYRNSYEKSMVDGEAIVLAYDATMLLGEAIRNSESLSGESTVEELYNIEGFSGASGIYRFDKDGNPMGKKLMVTEFKDGKREIVKE